MKEAFISGEQGNKGQILGGNRGTKTYWGSGNIKQIFDFWGTGEQANYFRGTREQRQTPQPPERASILWLLYSVLIFTHKRIFK